MNVLVQLVNEWAAFEKLHPGENIDTFCRYYLALEREKKGKAEFLEGVVPDKNVSILTKLLVKIVRMYNVYVDIATRDIKIKQSEEFYFLSVIKNLKSPNKTEAIYHTVNELSNGLNIISSLLNQRYIMEKNDPEDKRSKRITITEKGEQVLKECYIRIHQVSELMFGDMTGDDVALCIQLLKNVEIKFSPLVQRHKGKNFEDILNEV